MAQSETGAFASRPLALPIRLLLIAVGTLSLLVGLVAVVVPGLPTTEFVLLAAACYVRGSERLYRWLRSRPWLRPHFAAAQRYARTRALPLRVKAVAIGTAWLSLALLAAGTMPAPPWAVWAVLLAAVTCTVFMLRIGTVRE
jgi:uncharacterized membrane protein YbaN (DUF454 family)